MSALLLVHGAFHGAWCWERLLPRLEERGVTARTVELPFTSRRDDEQAVADGVVALRANRGHGNGGGDGDGGDGVVVVGHSLGGLVVGGACVRGERPLPGVAALVFLAALVVGRDEELAMEPSPGLASIHVEQERALVDPGGARAAFYHRSDPAIAEWAAGHLRPMPTSALIAPPSGEAWRLVPSSYVVCTDDQVIAPAQQRRMAARTARTVELDSDHSPFLACPAELADVLGTLVRDVGRGGAA